MTMATREPRTRRRTPRADMRPDAPVATTTVADLFRGWRHDPEAFIEQAILEPYNRLMGQQVRMTQQQREGTQAVKALLQAKIAVHHGTATPEQRELATKIGVSIQSGKGTGKDAWVSWMLAWFLTHFPFCKIPCTSLSATQLDVVLWSEVTKWIPSSLIGPYITIQKGKMFWNQPSPEFPPDAVGNRWFAYTKTANAKSTDLEPEGVAGAHEDYMLVVADEASGVPDAILSSLEGTCTQFGNLMVLIFNPTRSKGYAIDSQEKYAHRWVTLRWNAEESEIANPLVRERLLEDFGRDSNPYRIKVLGLPPIADATTLIPWDWIEEAVDRELIVDERDPLIKGVDCGAGGDHSVIVTRKGCQVYPIKRLTTPDSTVLTNWVANDIDGDRPDRVYVDTIGIGWAVEGNLREQKGSIVEAADVRRTADHADKYLNKRAEMYDRLREAFQRGTISIPNDEALKDQLGAIQADYSGSQMKIIEKKKLKKTIGHSPDEADALAMTFYRDAGLQSRVTAPRQRVPLPRQQEQGWLAA